MMERRIFLQTLVFGSGLFIFNQIKTGGMKNQDIRFRLRMIYNNTGESPGLKEAWGLAVWIEGENGVVLFDTGGDASVLRENTEHAGLEPGRISTIVISHDHWDHRNGLEYLLEASSHSPEILVPEEVADHYVQKYPGGRVRAISGPAEISPGIWSTGSLKTTYKGADLFEQALLFVHGSRLALLTGCSHPGIVEIVQRVNQTFPGKKIALVAGGFHLGSVNNAEILEISELLHQEGVEKIAPSHCTGNQAISMFRKDWGTNFVEFNLGDDINL